MTDNHYSAPGSNLDFKGGNVEDLLQPLLATRFWVRLCSVVGFVFTAIMVLVTLAMLVGFGAISRSLSADAGLGGGFGFVLAVIYLIFALFFFFPSLFLHKYASAITRADSSRSEQEIAVALRHQKSFWKFVGIVTLVYLILLTITFIFGLLGGMLA